MSKIGWVGWLAIKRKSGRLSSPDGWTTCMRWIRLLETPRRWWKNWNEQRLGPWNFVFVLCFVCWDFVELVFFYYGFYHLGDFFTTIWENLFDLVQHHGAWRVTIHHEKIGERSFHQVFLGGGISHIFYFHPYLRKWSNLTNIFQMGWFNHQPVVFQLGPP